MLSALDSVSRSYVSASSSSSSPLPVWVFIIVMVIAVISTVTKAVNRKNRAKNTAVYTPGVAVTPGVAARPGINGVAHQPTSAPYVGTLLNGVPMKPYDTGNGYQGAGFANERMRAESELKRQLDGLDAARRAGQVTAEQYAVHRDAIFKAF